MSDLSMYELEDIIWDDFNQDDDHIVPHLTNAWTSNKNSFEGDSCKKPRRETTSVVTHFSNLDASNTICQQKSERDTKVLDNKKNNTMDNNKESSSSHGVFNHASCDVKIVKDTSDDTRMPDKCFKNSYVTSAAGDDNSYSYQQEDLYNCEDKESGDLLYYNWPDIGNFEDVDNMLRSCDSSFGLDNDEEVGWFTSGQEALKMDFKFPCPELCNLNNVLPEGHLMDSCGDLSFEGTATENDDQKHGFQFQPLFVGKEMSPEIGSLHVPESSSVSSQLDEISLEATSFRHLQQVMEQLDLRTKLCIRDSLYRLARSAEQRHNDIGGGPLMDERSDTGLMDMETDTNPIDRSVAHLLFHRPSESPNMNVFDVQKHGSMKGGKAVCEEEANEK